MLSMAIYTVCKLCLSVITSVIWLWLIWLATLTHDYPQPDYSKARCGLGIKYCMYVRSTHSYVVPTAKAIMDYAIYTVAVTSQLTH